MDYRENIKRDETDYRTNDGNEKNEGEPIRADAGSFKRDDADEGLENESFEDYDEDDDYEEDFEEDIDAEEPEYSRKGRAGEIAFRIIAGALVVAICVTATFAALLATGRLNGVIDVLSEREAGSAAMEVSDNPTPTVRVALTSTPTPVKEQEVSSAPTAVPSSTGIPTADSSPADVLSSAPSPADAETAAQEKTDGEDAKPSASDSATIMTFTDVSDVVTAKETTNLRNVPSQGEESFIVYILQNGETVNRTGISDEGWSRLEYDGQVVYAMTNLLTTDLTKKEPTESTVAGSDESGGLPQIQTVFTDVNEQVTPKIEVNLRLLPSVTNPNATVVATIKNGEVVTRTGVNEDLGWSRVEYNGQTLYCISSYVETVTPQA
ncbi:MAG: hypothetical protein Q4A32_07060 [Lachnospiraceae bacterium]|nr:hypothetical protein [Lachnospiraceae bacterium]